MSDAQDAIGFTVVLYGVVASNALFRLPYDASLRTGMLLFAFLVLASDWIEYQVSVDDLGSDPGETLLAFGLDVLILVVWTYLTIVPPGDIPVFTGVLAVFVFIQWLSDLLLYGRVESGLLGQAELELPVSLGILLVIDRVVPLPGIVLFGTTVIAFLAYKYRTWQLLYEMTEDEPERLSTI